MPTFRMAHTSNTKISAETARTIKMLEGYISNNGVLPEEFKPKAPADAGK
jgi:hypothetical protein